MKEVFLLFLVIGGSLSMNIFNGCDVEICYEDYYKENFRDFGKPPSIDVIKRICPTLLEMAGCVGKKLKICTGEDIEELKFSKNESLATFATLAQNGRRVFKDLCDEKSELHKHYKENVNCTTEVIVSEQLGKCRERAGEAWMEFVSHLDLKWEEIDAKEFNKETNCMVASYGSACLASNFEEKCGTSAKESFVDIAFKGFQYVKIFYCKETKFSYLRPMFVNYLRERGVGISDLVDCSLRC